MIEAFFGGCHQGRWGAQRVQLRGFGLMERAVRSEANIKVGSECGTAGGKHGPVRDEPF